LNAPRIGLDGEIAGLVTVEAVSAAIKAARSERRGGNAGKKVVAAAVAPEQQTVKPAPEAVPETESKRLSSLSDLRTAAKARRATA
jgi:sRNA-binding protein